MAVTSAPETMSKIEPAAIADCVGRLRSRRPHVHCITNSVAQHFTANVLLAADCKPSMTIATAEIVDFVTMADALLVNLGTMDEERSEAVSLAVKTANDQDKPWALDPVFVQGSPQRLILAQSLLREKPTTVRCNTPEGKALFGSELDRGNLIETARTNATAIAVTGVEDIVSDGNGLVVLGNGSPLMDRVTAMGCALNAVIAAFCVVEPNRQLAAASAISLFNISGELAESKAAGPGTFVPHFLDTLANVETGTLEEKVVIK